jgi:hypothetical protein
LPSGNHAACHPAGGRKEAAAVNYVGLQDLIKRWIYTRQGVHKLMRSRDFPRPQFTINAGKTKVWYAPDIEGYEKRHPEVTSEGAKARKIGGYARAIQKGERRQA